MFWPNTKIGFEKFKLAIVIGREAFLENVEVHQSKYGKVEVRRTLKYLIILFAKDWGTH